MHVFLIRKKCPCVRPANQNVTLCAKMSHFGERDPSALLFLITVPVFSAGLEVVRIQMRRALPVGLLTTALRCALLRRGAVRGVRTRRTPPRQLLRGGGDMRILKRHLVVEHQRRAELGSAHPSNLAWDLGM